MLKYLKLSIRSSCFFVSFLEYQEFVVSLLIDDNSKIEQNGVKARENTQ